MFSTKWATSPREHDVIIERNVRIRMSDGVYLDGDLFRPASQGAFPAILGVHAYDNAMQSVPTMPQAMQGKNAQAEAGDPHFYVRRGYVHLIANARGTGRSEGLYSHYGPRDVEDIREIIAWLAEQPWCDGNVGMFGVSYFSVASKQVAATNPPALKAIWGQYGYTDFYRDKFYHGGILAHTFLTSWAKHLAGVRVDPWSRRNLGDEEYERRLAALRADKDIMAVPELAAAVRNSEDGPNPIILDVLLNPEDGPYWHERAPDLEAIKVPIMLGACWGMYGLHLPGEFRAWEKITAPKKMIVGPPIYLDRPVYQYAEASLRWFDHWLKGNDTGIMEEPAIQLFMMNSGGRWIDSQEWPLPETRWHNFFLHRDGLLSEHEFWPNEGATSFEDNNFNKRGAIEFTTPPLVEETEIVGPAKLTVYASTTDEEILLFASLWDVAEDGTSRILTRGWLRGTLSGVDPSKSSDWQTHHRLAGKTPIEPNVPKRYEINIIPTANRFPEGHRIRLRISASDDEVPESFLDLLAQGHLVRQRPSWISIHHDADHPSAIELPIISGNRIGTYISGGGARRKASGGDQGKRGWDRW
ncbi:CocE/NonD family hydrolase [Altererythrobacter sp. BO-6]|uniref:CocE/NonD family hydrolase n=1 Tax=Altererythrobacter sp. BO-6 TaxID=2604537 RepID=UPI0013E1D91C|nr:CocE/NonD family hydrolase [Altererythrobacter sp. BO-6]QIG53774.1 CocE/NonD family hydrolase [Altererythrobacter sp. BO-6]